MDRYPKKKCKFCYDLKPNHFPYACRKNPKVMARQKIGMKRTPIKKIGKKTQEWFDARAKWIKDNPMPAGGWVCYLRIHPWCPVRLDLKHLTLDHVISRSHDARLRTDQSNLKPACEYCNNMKGSQSLDQVKPTAV